VNLVVSTGPPAVVPQLRGDTLAEARHALRAAGLILGTVNYEPGASGIVLDQAARAGRTLPPGTQITVVVGQTTAGSSGAPTPTSAGNSGN
jgi:beta-lactam-binding protein with PASTA domain